LVLVPVLVHAHFAQRLRVADPIPADVVPAPADAQVVVQSGDRVAEDVLTGSGEEDVVRENACSRLRAEVGFVRDGAPDVVPRVDRLYARRDLRAHGGADSVRTDQDVGALATAAGEMRNHARAVLVDALETVAEVIASLVDGLAQQPLQPIPRSQDLRQGLFSDHPPIAIQGDSFLDLAAQVEGARAAL